ncbi:hypothetical protein PUNSTDRAFT_119169 [Punctularia strigosozonata HHB-11173 SS5]|uniref:uncharacterized protein n=1 Tax=Punctularia strigosozonata (strain HHB-11173) TaxID=741275 RepID=UPI0004417FE1|nr:uncharacterized protein PUNSTDRAFT_119169 [Punctularia strigosozonata HHB-11173 SS5]EIN12001.1 hypothetical protein PUNSTDRAFT_119169 [Punctularia strigosozonata HHB-11173 SS5]
MPRHQSLHLSQGEASKASRAQLLIDIGGPCVIDALSGGNWTCPSRSIAWFPRHLPSRLCMPRRGQDSFCRSTFKRGADSVNHWVHVVEMTFV